MALVGKKILCVGGNGYVGNYLAARLIQSKASVSILCRSGPRYKHPENDDVNWLIGDVLKPEKFKQQINQANVIIHTVGVLFDTSISKNIFPGGPGTYEQMNRDSLKCILDSIDPQVQKKKIVYMSGVGHPPFIPRYATTKAEAELMLLQSRHDGYVFKPGFIYNWEHRKVSIPLKYSINAFLKIYPKIYQLAQNGSHLQKFLQQFELSEPTSLEKMGDGLIELISQEDQKVLQSLVYGKRVLFNEEMYNLSEAYLKNIKSL